MGRNRGWLTTRCSVKCAVINKSFPIVTAITFADCLSKIGSDNDIWTHLRLVYMAVSCLPVITNDAIKGSGYAELTSILLVSFVYIKVSHDQFILTDTNRGGQKRPSSHSTNACSFQLNFHHQVSYYLLFLQDHDENLMGCMHFRTIISPIQVTVGIAR